MRCADPRVDSARSPRLTRSNRATHNGVVSRYVDARIGKGVEEDDEAKGYQRGENDYILLEDHELEIARLEGQRADGTAIVTTDMAMVHTTVN